MFAVVEGPIDVAAVMVAVTRDGYGGVATFLGVVRDRADDGRAVTGLEYEAFVPMALETFATIANEVRSRSGDVALAIVHRIGKLKVGEVAVAVVAAAVHRDAAFDACRYAIDELKARAPIWKKEAYAGGDASWRENACGRHA